MKVDKAKWEKSKIQKYCRSKSNIRWMSSERDSYRYIDLTSVDIRSHKILVTSNINHENAPSRAKQIVNASDVIFATTRPLQLRCCIIPSEYDNEICSTGFCVIKPQNIAPKWLFYNLISDRFVEYIAPLQKGATYPAISDKDVLNYCIYVPHLKEQKAIVAELDAVQAMIDGYREQLADLDRLAQSIFLDTFGDPISNPKGWEISSFGDLFSLKSGDGLSAKNFNGGDFPVYGGNGIVGFHDSFNKDGIYIVIGRVGALCGNIHLVKGKFWLTDNAFELIQKKSLFNNLFLARLLAILNLGSKAKKMVQPVISNVSLKDISVVIPPFPLQQQFAEQVEAIERQKEAIRQQLADAETLMSERMQYYFS